MHHRLHALCRTRRLHRLTEATSLSITNRTAELQLMTPPLIPLPETIHVQTDPALLLQLTQSYREWLPQPPRPILSRACSYAYPGSSVISDQRDGCPYHVTSYRDDDHSSLDSPSCAVTPRAYSPHHVPHATPSFSSGWARRNQPACGVVAGHDTTGHPAHCVTATV